MSRDVCVRVPITNGGAMPERPRSPTRRPADAVGAVASLGEPTRRGAVRVRRRAPATGSRGTRRRRGRPRARHRRAPSRPARRRRTAGGRLPAPVGPTGSRRGPAREALPPRAARLRRRRCRRARTSSPGGCSPRPPTRRGSKASTSRRALDAAARAEGPPARRRDPRRAVAGVRRDRRRASAASCSTRSQRAASNRGRADDGTVVLRNCPFHTLAQQHTDLICGMNLCLLDAAIEGVGERDSKPGSNRRRDSVA